MKSSIRKFLLINLLLAITLTTTLTAIGNFYLDQKDIERHLDTLMAISALSYQALLSGDLTKHSLKKAQILLNLIPKKIEAYYQYVFYKNRQPYNHYNKFSFQVWSNNGKLLLYSPNSLQPTITSQDNGFSNKIINNQVWRVFTVYDPEYKVRTVLSEHYDTRNALGHRIAQDDLYIMLLTFPLSGLLIWIIIGRGLSSLDKVANEVANRAPNNLETVDLKNVPQEIKPVIDELNKLFNRLAEGFEREQRFAADAAHELRTPLASLKAQAQVALNSSNLDDKNAALKKLIISVNRSTHIVQQLLIISRLTSYTSKPSQLEKINLPKISKEIIAMLFPFALEKNIELIYENTQDIVEFYGNTTAISILIRNLLDNSIKYCNQYDKITFRVYEENNDVILTIHDNGPGIPVELHDRVFERFFRVLGNHAQGSGLGLSIVREIVNAHGGKIQLNAPEHGNGLIVKVFFPINRKLK